MRKKKTNKKIPKRRRKTRKRFVKNGGSKLF